MHVTSLHAPSTKRWKITWSGSSRTWLNTELTMLSCSPTVKVAGTLYSRTILASRLGAPPACGGLLAFCGSQPSRPPSGAGPAYVKLVCHEQHPDRGRDLRCRRPRRGGQGRRGSRELAAVVLRPAVDGGRGPGRDGGPLDGGRRSHRDHGDLAAIRARRGRPALFCARGAVGGGGGG